MCHAERRYEMPGCQHRGMLGYVHALVCGLLKVEAWAGLKSDVDPAVLWTVIYSVRFEFHLNTNTHVLFLASRWGAPCQPALQHSLCLWLYGSWRAHSFGNSTTYKERGTGGTTTMCMCRKDWGLMGIPCWVLHKQGCFSYLPDGGIDARTPRNFLMRDDKKVLSFLALQETNINPIRYNSSLVLENKS